MTVTLTPSIIFGFISAGVPLVAALLLGLRYVIRAETSELRANSGSTVKDRVGQIVELAEEAKVSAGVAARMAEKSAGMAEKSARVATETKDALDEHVRQSALLIEQGAKDKADIVARQDAQDATIAEQRHTISNLAESLPVVARSTPPEETPNG
jgi:hypothetical protein